jgi:hypothetical protein
MMILTIEYLMFMVVLVFKFVEVVELKKIRSFKKICCRAYTVTSRQG